MVRALLIFLLVAVIAIGAVWLADHPGTLVVEWLGVRIEASVALGLVALLLAVFVLYVLLQIIGWVFGRFAAVGTYVAGHKERRAHTALTRGLIALAAGDASTARKVVTDASKAQRDRPLLLLLHAQTAELTGADTEAESAYQAMLDVPETEVLGLVGLMGLARDQGDVTKALEIAGRAFRLQPGNARVFRTLFTLQLQTEQWAAARRTVEAANKARLLRNAAARRRLAVLMTAEAMAARRDGKSQAALNLAQKALSLAPDLAPAAVLAADVLKNFGKKGRAGTVIETIWPHMPHAELGRIYAQLHPRENAEERLARIKGLVELNRDHVESRILFARYAIAAENFAAARDALAPLLEIAPTTRVAELMARLEETEHGDTKAAEEWLGQAAHAPRDALWLCRSCGRQSTQWSALCPQCNSFDSQYWKASGDMTLFADEGEETEDPDLLIAQAMAEDDQEPGLLSRILGTGGGAKPAPEPAKPPEPETSRTVDLVPMDRGDRRDGPVIDAVVEETDNKPPEREEKKPASSEDKPRKTEPDDKGGQDQPKRESDKSEIYVPPRPPDDPGPEKDDDSGERAGRWS